MDENGNGHIYVKFGPLDTHELRIETAERVLIRWRESNPSNFRKVLGEVLTEDIKEK